MSIWNGLSEAMDPHIKSTQAAATLHMAALQTRLHSIERAVSDLGRGDIGNKWQRFSVRRKFLAGEQFEVGTCPINEIWLLQALSSDGVQEKSPAYVIEANNVLIESIIKEGLGFEGIGGDQVILPGEIMTMTARAEGNINCTITIIRRAYPVSHIAFDKGKDTDMYSPRNTHEDERDVIMSRTGLWREPGIAEIAPTEGRAG
jgi:hypothetical protein